MNYRNMMKRQQPDKIALIEDGRTITYRQLLNWSQEKTKSIRKEGKVGCASMLEQQRERNKEESCQIKKKLYLIKADTIAEELTAFLACQDGRMIPVILEQDVTETETETLKQTEIPKGAVMGVLTSGTTGRHKILFRTYESWADYFPYQNEIFGMQEDTVLFAQGSLAFTGNMNLYMALFSIGGTVVATKHFLPKSWIDTIQQYKVNHIYLIPVKMQALCKAMEEPCRGVKHFVTGSQSFGGRETKEVKRSFPEAEIILYYGCSEANYITYVTEKDMTGDSRLVGRPFPKVKVELSNGTFYLESNYGIIGIEHPFCTKDMGSMDSEGRFYFEGRQDDLLNVNGRKCSAYRIEQVIRNRTKISNVMVIVERKGSHDSLVAYYEGTDKLSFARIRTTLKKELTEQEIPKRFIKVESLPRTESGKIRREQSYVSN